MIMDRDRSSFCFHLIVICVACVTLTNADAHSESTLKGHLQPFGESGTVKEIEVRYEFPEPHDFLVNYMQHLKPVKLSGVIKNTPAVLKWTDSYLLTLDVPHHSVVQLETIKKESREQDIKEMHFHDFLRIYNQTEYYMVDDVPKYLSPDITVPCSMQCPEILEEGLAFAMMWFSSGGTKSVVHTDSFDNMNCVLRGKKTFVMMDPARDREKIKLRTKGSYADVDVDSVDLTVYPELAEAEFYHVHVEAGDCFYIPYLWIHQVRSFNSNVAVNFWWNHYAFTDLLEGKQESVCQGRCDTELTLDKLKLHRSDEMFKNYKSVRDWVRNFVLIKPFTLASAFTLLKEEFDVQYFPADAKKFITEMFEKLDLDQDGVFTKEEHGKVPMKIWKEVQKSAAGLSEMFETDEEANRREYAAYLEAREREEL